MTERQYINQAVWRYGMKLNPNVAIVDALFQSLGRTDGFCPCVPRWRWSEDTRCPCKAMREGKDCHCGLYVRDTEKHTVSKTAPTEAELDEIFDPTD